jgi:hypothetical protein
MRPDQRRDAMTGRLVGGARLLADSGEPLVDDEFVAAIESAAEVGDDCKAPIAPPYEFDPPDPQADGRLAYPDWDASTTRVVSFLRSQQTEADAWTKLERKYKGRILGSAHTASRWAWRVRATPYREVR